MNISVTMRNLRKKYLKIKGFYTTLLIPQLFIMCYCINVAVIICIQSDLMCPMIITVTLVCVLEASCQTQ